MSQNNPKKLGVEINSAEVDMARQSTNEWTYESILEYKLLTIYNLEIYIRISTPWRSTCSEWICAFQLIGINDDFVYHAHAEDGLQAIFIASSSLRRRLEEVNNIVSDKTPYEPVLPKTIPWELGLDLHRSLAQMVDAEIKKEENRLLKS